MKKIGNFLIKTAFVFLAVFVLQIAMPSAAHAATRTISNVGGNWNATTAWAEGAVPTAADNVVATGASGNLTINVVAACRSIDLTGYTKTITHNAGIILSIGDATASPGNNALIFPSSGWAYTLGNATTSAISFVSTSLFAQNINFGGKTAGNVTFNGVNGSWQLTGALNLGTTATLTLTAGTFNGNNQNITAGIFASSGAVTRSIIMGSGAINITGSNTTVFNLNTVTGFSIIRGSPFSFTYSGGVGTRTIIPGLTGATESNSPDISITAGTDAVSIANSQGVIHNLSFTGYSGTSTNTGGTMNIYGNFTASATMTFGGANGFSFKATSGTQLLTSAGNTTMDFPLTFDGIGGIFQLQDNWIPTQLTPRTFTLTNGTFDANNKNIKFGSFASSNANTRTLFMGSGTWEMTQTSAVNVWNVTNGTFNLNPGTSTIKISGSTNLTRTFIGGGKTYNNLWITNATPLGEVDITGSNTFSDIKWQTTTAQTLKFTAGTTTTVTTFTASGTAGNLLTLNSTTTATHTLTKSGGGTISADYFNVQHTICAPANTWYLGANSTNNQAVATAGSGCLFSSPVGTLTVKKAVTNDNGGSATSSSFTMHIKSGGVDSVTPFLGSTGGTSYSLAVGTYVVSEDAFSGYSGSFIAGAGQDCDSSGNITIGIGDIKTCTITNDDNPATLTLVKNITNHGQTKTSTDFTPKIGGAPVSWGATILNGGSYVVSETPDSSYDTVISGDCTSGGNVTLVVGDSKICSITNTEKESTITVQKVVSGPDAASHFAPYKVDATTVTLGVAATFVSGNHTVTELTDANYGASFSGACNSSGQITLASGTNVTCTITNTSTSSGPPTVTNFNVVSSDISGIPGAGTATFSWTATMQNQTTESQYEFQLSLSSDPTFTCAGLGTCPVDRTVTGLSGASPANNSQMVLIRQVSDDNSIMYNASYNCRVRVTDSAANNSGWVACPVYQRNGHPAPYVAFTYSPQTVIPNSPVTFINDSSCYDNSGPADCQSYAWNFGDSGTSTLINPTHTYTSIGIYTVTLIVKDSSNVTNQAQATVNVGVQKHPPGWKEI